MSAITKAQFLADKESFVVLCQPQRPGSKLAMLGGKESPRSDGSEGNEPEPYYIKKWGEDIWVFYWNKGSKSWVSFRKIKDADEYETLRRSALHAQEAVLYFPDAHGKF